MSKQHNKRKNAQKQGRKQNNFSKNFANSATKNEDVESSSIPAELTKNTHEEGGLDVAKLDTPTPADPSTTNANGEGLKLTKKDEKSNIKTTSTASTGSINAEENFFDATIDEDATSPANPSNKKTEGNELGITENSPVSLDPETAAAIAEAKRRAEHQAKVLAILARDFTAQRKRSFRRIVALSIGSVALLLLLAIIFFMFCRWYTLGAGVAIIALVVAQIWLRFFKKWNRNLDSRDGDNWDDDNARNTPNRLDDMSEISADNIDNVDNVENINKKEPASNKK